MTASRRRAPAFQLEVRAPFLWRALHMLVWTLGLATGTAALALQAEARIGPGVALAGVATAGLLLPSVMVWAWRQAAGGVSQLLWDGEGWALRDGPARQAAQEDAERRAVTLTAAMDLGGFLLLCCRPVATGACASRAPGAARFLPVSRRHHRGAWLPLRWALFSARRLPPGMN